jgi:hypothetical protein
MLDFRSWFLFNEAPSDYTWIEKDPEDYETELAAWNKSGRKGEMPSLRKKVLFKDLEERVPKGSGGYKLVDKDKEDYEAELAAFNKEVQQRKLDRSKLSYYDPLTGKEYNKPYPYKKIPYVAPARKKKPKTAEEIAYDAAEKEASKYRTEEEKETRQRRLQMSNLPLWRQKRQG